MPSGPMDDDGLTMEQEAGRPNDPSNLDVVVAIVPTTVLLALSVGG